MGDKVKFGISNCHVFLCLKEVLDSDKMGNQPTSYRQLFTMVLQAVSNPSNPDTS